MQVLQKQRGMDHLLCTSAAQIWKCCNYALPFSVASPVVSLHWHSSTASAEFLQLSFWSLSALLVIIIINTHTKKCWNHAKCWLLVPVLWRIIYQPDAKFSRLEGSRVSAAPWCLLLANLFLSAAEYGFFWCDVWHCWEQLPIAVKRVLNCTSGPS